MANEPQVPDASPFDITRIRQLVRLMRDNDLNEIDLRWDNARVRLRRGPENTIATSLVPAVPMGRAPVPARGDSATDVEVSAEATARSAPKANLPTVNSPIVGTFYAAPSPDAEPFVKVGSRVTPESIVCVIEAMKVFNEIPAGISGTIVEVLVENGSPVEYGQPLFRVEP